MKPLKVYGGTFDGRNRLIVAATSHTQAIRKWQAYMKNMSDHYARQFSCETGNNEEITVALSIPGEIFSANVQSGYPRQYKQVKK